ncbi:putative complement receptor type 2-like, partial [Apostichopus japonicus]
DPCDNGCVVPRSLANGRYSVRSGNVDSTVAPGSCFSDNYLRVECNPGNSLTGSHFYTCYQTTGKLDYHNTGYREMLSDCGSSCPRPQINPNVLYFVGENNDPIGDRTAFNQAEVIYSKCEDPRYQLHVGHNRRRVNVEHGLPAYGLVVLQDISQLHMDITPTTSLTISSSGQFVLVTPIDEVTISCRNRLNIAQLSGDTRIRKNGEDTHGERSDDTSVFLLVIINPTAEDNGIYTCLSSGLSHSISVAFEETPVCSSPTTNPHVIALVGENNLPIASRVSFSEGERLAFLCEDDMTLVGANSIECIEGQWTGRTPTCEDNRCSRPDIFPNIIAHVGVGEDTTEIGNRQSFMGGETITFRCEDVRYQILDGPIHRQCIDGEWTERAPRCDIRCPAPGNVSNGRWAYVRATGNRLDPHAYILNEKVTVQCNPGYHASSNQESRCNYQGQWSPPLSSCIAD